MATHLVLGVLGHHIRLTSDGVMPGVLFVAGTRELHVRLLFVRNDVVLILRSVVKSSIALFLRLTVTEVSRIASRTRVSIRLRILLSIL